LARYFNRPVDQHPTPPPQSPGPGPYDMLLKALMDRIEAQGEKLGVKPFLLGIYESLIFTLQIIDAMIFSPYGCSERENMLEMQNSQALD
jgi:hypothetical protein